MPKHTEHKRRIPKTRERYTICNYCKAKDLPCDNKIPCTFCKLTKVNLLHTIEEAKLIFKSLKEQHDFDKLYKTLDNLQDISNKESECPNTLQQVKKIHTTPYSKHAYIKYHNHKRKCTKELSTNINNCDNCIE
ncbi:2788_t:CDS:2 [Racocetra persica]|uniref:2788_t:CDS:1 n=1 Tax=Racocetra persica TaxID=160502 RepID=A0ACA9Q5H3_9GLOM|nr:2788_t:CDS:2 [Racocetra persica]